MGTQDTGTDDFDRGTIGEEEGAKTTGGAGEFRDSPVMPLEGSRHWSRTTDGGG